MTTNQLGLALGGGGGKGSAHLGVLRVIEKLQLPVDVISGTSIGGIVGAVFAAGYTTLQIEQAFRQAHLHRILEHDPRHWGLLGTSKLEAILTGLLGDQLIEDLPIRFGVVAVDLVSGQEVHIVKGRLVDAALATSAVPGIFPPLKSEARLLADGGILNNLPVNLARALGAGRVIAVDLIGIGQQFELPEEARPFSIRHLLPIVQSQILERALALMIGRMTADRLRETPPDLLLAPNASTISMLDIRRIDDGLAAGAEAARTYQAELVELRAWRLAERELNR